MKILAMEVEEEGVKSEQFAPYLKAEARRVWELYESGAIRELDFRADRSEAVLILECVDVARRVLSVELDLHGIDPELPVARKAHEERELGVGRIEQLLLELRQLRRDGQRVLLDVLHLLVEPFDQLFRHRLCRRSTRQRAAGNRCEEFVKAIHKCLSPISSAAPKEQHSVPLGIGIPK